jgi:hypothetical protein
MNDIIMRLQVHSPKAEIARGFDANAPAVLLDPEKIIKPK